MKMSEAGVAIKNRVFHQIIFYGLCFTITFKSCPFLELQREPKL